MEEIVESAQNNLVSSAVKKRAMLNKLIRYKDIQAMSAGNKAWRWFISLVIVTPICLLAYSLSRCTFDNVRNITDFRFIHDYLHETQYFHQAIENSRLEMILPPSAREIRTKWNSDYNTMIVSFTFNNEVEHVWRSSLRLLSMDEVVAKNPRWALRERWFPEELRVGNWDVVWDMGLRVYVDDSAHAAWSKAWYFALRPGSTNGYAWCGEGTPCLER
ncbi:MAG: hypothetical protein M5U15_14290 [Kiritimatiellae bacterium]|nr:hypothetical protein [Kiritimatiellia bacterium]